MQLCMKSYFTPIDQIVIIMFAKMPASIRKRQTEYLPELGEAIKYFYKYYEEKTKAQ